VVWLSVKVAVITASLSVVLIFIRSVLSRTVSVCGTGVGGTAVAVSVGVGGTVVGIGDGVDVGVDVQAATKTAAAIGTIIRR
jgi:hypothetical protein